MSRICELSLLRQKKRKPWIAKPFIIYTYILMTQRIASINIFMIILISYNILMSFLWSKAIPSSLFTGIYLRTVLIMT